MTIDAARVAGHQVELGAFSWSPQDVILYHLGIGAGQERPEAELAYLYERDLVVVPSFATTVFTYGPDEMLAIPGLDFDPTQVLHGEQETVLHRPLPPRQSGSAVLTIEEVEDKGSGAMLHMRIDAVDAADDPVFTTRSKAFLRGAGGFGGDRRPSSPDPQPDRDPDVVLSRPTMVQQAALFRLNGDNNPLHIDPVFASKGGFDRPILHGLCTYGMVLKAAVDAFLGGEPSRVTRFSARFAGIVLPGETIAVSLWDGLGVIHASAAIEERQAPAITRGVVEYR